jgi:hypothetical protein
VSKRAIVAALICFVSGCVSGWYVGVSRGVPFVGKEPTEWAIGIYTGESPFELSPARKAANPVLTADDVSDVPARFVADPFILQESDAWYMFFEVMNAQTDQGDIGLATSADGLRWTYSQIVLDEPFHLSYPYVFKWQGEFFMVPESRRANSVRLYKSISFPTRWAFVGVLLEGAYGDPSVFCFDDMWWMFVCPTSDENDTLRLYYAADLMGPWIEHPKSPIVEGNANAARPGGRVLVLDGRVIRFAQDDEPVYGNRVRAFEITELTTGSYRETGAGPDPLLGPSGKGWNARRMHQVDLHQIGENRWIACVDGAGEKLVFGLQY